MQPASSPRPWRPGCTPSATATRSDPRRPPGVLVAAEPGLGQALEAASSTSAAAKSSNGTPLVSTPSRSRTVSSPDSISLSPITSDVRHLHQLRRADLLADGLAARRPRRAAARALAGATRARARARRDGRRPAPAGSAPARATAGTRRRSARSARALNRSSVPRIARWIITGRCRWLSSPTYSMSNRSGKREVALHRRELPQPPDRVPEMEVDLRSVERPLALGDLGTRARCARARPGARRSRAPPSRASRSSRRAASRALTTGSVNPNVPMDLEREVEHVEDLVDQLVRRADDVRVVLRAPADPQEPVDVPSRSCR